MIRGLLIVSLLLLAPLAGYAAEPATFFEKHCYACHDSATKEAGLDLSALKLRPRCTVPRENPNGAPACSRFREK